MKDIETQHRFLELRAQGKSLRTVAEELAVGRQTLVRWEREYKEQIENLKAMELDALLERHRLTVQAQRRNGELSAITVVILNRQLLTLRDAKELRTSRLITSPNCVKETQDTNRSLANIPSSLHLSRPEMFFRLIIPH